MTKLFYTKVGSFYHICIVIGICWYKKLLVSASVSTDKKNAFIGVYQYWLISNKPYRSYPDPGLGYTFAPSLSLWNTSPSKVKTKCTLTFFPHQKGSTTPFFFTIFICNSIDANSKPWILAKRNYSDSTKEHDIFLKLEYFFFEKNTM